MMRRMNPRLLAIPALVVVLAAPAARAEAADWLWGGGLHGGVPTGDFDDLTDEGYGAAGHFVLLPAGRPFGLRGEVSALVYDSRTYGSESDVDYGTVRTDSWFGNMLLGPELRLRQGAVRPYVHALAGLGYFATSSEGTGAAGQFTTHQDDATFAWAVGGGVEIAVGRSTSIDLGVRYLANGDVDYVAGGHLPVDGSPPVAFTTRTEAHVVAFTLGLAFGR